MYAQTPLTALNFQDGIASRSTLSTGTRTRGKIHRAGLFFVILAASAWAAKIDSVSRSARCDGQGADFSPFAEDDQALNNSSSQAGAFAGEVSLPIVLNDNTSLYKALQNSTINLSALSFSGSGSIQTSQLTHFDATDQINRAFLQGSAGSTFTVFFTLAQSGKVTLSVAISATKSIWGTTPTLIGGSSGSVQISKGTTVVWSRFTESGTVSFNGDVPLAAGQYQLTVMASANVDTGSPTGEQLATTDASFSISGQIVETKSAGGGKKGK